MGAALIVPEPYRVTKVIIEMDGATAIITFKRWETNEVIGPPDQRIAGTDRIAARRLVEAALNATLEPMRRRFGGRDTIMVDRVMMFAVIRR